VALGVQLASSKSLKLETDTVITSAIRLIISPGLALLLVGFFGLSGIERGAGIMQAAMPAAVLTSIIALEYDLLPVFVTRTVLFSTLASVLTLTLMLALV
ncbi:MAG: AEC family transporter, partial [Chloroflexota bacterium]